MNNNQNNNETHDERTCDNAFMLSVIAFAASFIVSYSSLLNIITIILATKGLNTKKRNKAIAAIVLSTLGLIVAAGKRLL